MMPTQSLSRAASWVIRETETSKVMFETFSPMVAARVNKPKYEAVPILEYLQGLNEPAKVRLYHVVAVNDRTGFGTPLTAYPMPHPEACAMRGKFNPASHVRIVLEEAQQ